MADLALPSLGARPSPREIWGWVARGEVALAIGIVGIIVLLILPIPAWMLDLLLAISITSSVLILMTALMIKKPLEFTAFPTVLLVTTLYRLGLNLAATSAMRDEPRVTTTKFTITRIANTMMPITKLPCMIRWPNA